MVLAATIAYWVYTGEQTLLFRRGQDSLYLVKWFPWQLKVIYGFWLIQLLLVEYRSVLLKLTSSPSAILHPL
ncbi:hypothetical protein O9929_14255 [Vibrio lentus]|nr:hypothetical protein [Vibrio lentus]